MPSSSSPSRALCVTTSCGASRWLSSQGLLVVSRFGALASAASANTSAGWRGESAVIASRPDFAAATGARIWPPAATRDPPAAAVGRTSPSTVSTPSLPTNAIVSGAVHAMSPTCPM